MSSTQEVGEIFGTGFAPSHAMLRSPTVLIAAIGLWGMNLYFFRLFGIDYVKVLKYDLFKLANEEMERHANHNANTANNNALADNATITTINNESSSSLNEVDDDYFDGDDNNKDDDVDNSKTITSHVRSESDNRIIYEYSKDIHNTPISLSKKSKVTMSTNNINNISSGNSNGGPNGIITASTVSALSNNSMNIAAVNVPSPIQDHASDDENDDDYEASIMESGNSMSSTDKASLLTSASAAGIIGGNLSVSYTAVTWDRLVGLSMSLLFVLHGTYYIWIDILHRHSIGAIFCFYLAVTTFILFPLRTTMWLRKSSKIVLARMFELITLRCWCFRITDFYVKRPNGPRAIPFVDVFFADAMCSLSKVFFDWGMLLHMAYYYPNPVPPSANNILIPSAFAAIPYLIRARQCLIMYSITRIKNDPGRYQHLWNALKYSTSIFPLLLSAYQKTVRPTKSDQLDRYLIILLIINATYSLFWDIVMDWGMMKNPSAAVTYVVCTNSMSNTNNNNSVGGTNNLGSTNANKMQRNGNANMNNNNMPSSCWHVLLRQRLRFGIAMSVVILVTDAILRFSWTLRFYHNVFPSGDSFVLCTQFLEIFRRAIWNLLRVEWENIKQHQQSITATTSGNHFNINNYGGSINNNNNNTLHQHHLAVHYNLISRHNSNSAVNIELTPNINNLINNKDDEDKVKLLMQRSNAHHVVASNKVKP